MYIVLKKLWDLADKKNKTQFIGLIFFSTITSFFEVMTISSILPLFSKILGIGNSIYNTSELPILSETLLKMKLGEEAAFITFSTFLLFACLCRVFLLWAILRFSHKVGSDFGVLIFKKTLQQPFEYHLITNSNEILSSLTKKINILSLEVIHPILYLISNLIIVLSVFFYFTITVGFKIIIFFIFFSLIFIIFWLITKQAIMKNSNIIASNSDNLVKIVTETFSAIKLISLQRIYQKFCEQFDVVNRKLKYSEGNNVFYSQSIRLWLELILILLGITYLAFAYKDKTIMGLLPLLGAVTFGIYRVIPIILKAYSNFSTLMGAKASAEDIYNFLSLKNENYKHNLKEDLIFNKTIDVSNVTYSYPNANNISLSNINISIRKGELTGIVGETGSGKSTLILLLCGLISPNRGKILVDGRPLDIKNLENWKSKISFVPQENIIFDGSISSNILLGDEEILNCKKLDEILSITRLEKFKNLKNIQNITGERGNKLSGGERQRIGIARALYADKEIIILDEPFSSLDKKTGEQILKNLKKIRDLTVIVVTHDEFVVPFCDKIINLNNKN